MSISTAPETAGRNGSGRDHVPSPEVLATPASPARRRPRRSGSGVKSAARPAPAPRRRAPRRSAAAADDAVSVQAEAAVAAGDAVAAPTPAALLAAAAAALAQGRTVGRESVRFGVEVARLLAGRSSLAPARGDRRFSDPTWEENPAFRRLMQFYLAFGRGVNNLVEDLEQGGADWHTVEQARFASSILVSALAPTNAPWSNPAALKRGFETGGRSLLRGLGNFIGDVRHNGGMPSQTDRSAFVVGRDLAVTPGAVVARTELAEVIQYRPTTSKVRERPVLIIPPPIGRFYFLDLRPGRSFVEYAVGRGLQTFMLSWRNPTREQGAWDMDAYAEAILDAIGSVRQVTGSDDVNLIGFCAGGILTTTVLNHLAERRQDLVRSMSYAVTLLDFGIPAPIGAFASKPLLSAARSNSRRTGIISARQMGTVFTWMRPDDLVFNYWVNNYLMGNPPPVFDILAWNADGTNLPAALHAQFLDIFGRNDLCRPGGLSVLGSPIDLKSVRVPTFVTGGVTDHLTPWRGCYRTTQLLGGPSTFVLSNAGHIASLVNPPGNPKATYYVGGEPGPDPDQWLAGASQKTGSWWEPWSDWVLERAGAERNAPARLGSRRHPARDPAPGLYVRDAVPA